MTILYRAARTDLCIAHFLLCSFMQEDAWLRFKLWISVHLKKKNIEKPSKYFPLSITIQENEIKATLHRGTFFLNVDWALYGAHGSVMLVSDKITFDFFFFNQFVRRVRVSSPWWMAMALPPQPPQIINWVSPMSKHTCCKWRLTLMLVVVILKFLSSRFCSEKGALKSIRGREDHIYLSWFC